MRSSSVLSSPSLALGKIVTVTEPFVYFSVRALNFSAARWNESFSFTTWASLISRANADAAMESRNRVTRKTENAFFIPEHLPKKCGPTKDLPKICHLVYH